MTGRTHDLAAVTALIAVVLVHPPGELTMATAVAALIANQIGGIAPDIDQPTAPFWRNLPIGKFFGKIFGKLIGGHRFLTHSILGLLILAFLVDMALNALGPLMPRVDTGYVLWAFLIGAVSHLIMDSFTKEGVPWLLPIPFRFGFPPLRKLRFTTGKIFEVGIIFPGLIALDIWLLASNSTFFMDMLHAHIK